MGNLETLEAIASFSFFSGNVEDGVNKLSTLSVVTLGPVVSSSGLTEDEVVRSEELTEGSSSNRVHCSRLEIHKDSSGNESSSSGFIVVNVDSLELKVRVSVVGTGWVDSVLIRNNLPELGSDLVTALTSLDVYNLSHGCSNKISCKNQFELRLNAIISFKFIL